MDTDPITVTLGNKEASEFRLFQKNYDLFSKLEEHGAFDMQFGKITLNIAFGTLQNIVKEQVVYRLPTERRNNR